MLEDAAIDPISSYTLIVEASRRLDHIINGSSEVFEKGAEDYGAHVSTLGEWVNAFQLGIPPAMKNQTAGRPTSQTTRESTKQATDLTTKKRDKGKGRAEGEHPDNSLGGVEVRVRCTVSPMDEQPVAGPSNPASVATPSAPPPGAVDLRNAIFQEFVENTRLFAANLESFTKFHDPSGTQDVDSAPLRLRGGGDVSEAADFHHLGYDDVEENTTGNSHDALALEVPDIPCNSRSLLWISARGGSE